MFCPGLRILGILLFREVSQPVLHPIDRHRQKPNERLRVEFRRRRWVAARGNDALRPLETPCKRLALFARQQFLQSRHVLVLLVLNVVVEVVEEGVEQGHEP